MARLRITTAEGRTSRHIRAISTASPEIEGIAMDTDERGIAVDEVDKPFSRRNTGAFASIIAAVKPLLSSIAAK